MLEDFRFQPNDKVIVRLADTDTGRPRFYEGHIVANEGVKDAGYFVDCEINDQLITYAVTFYDVMSFHKRHLKELLWAQQSIDHYYKEITDIWKWGKPVGQSTPTKTGE